MFARSVKLHLRPRYRKTKSGKKSLTGYSVEAYDPTRTPKRKWVSLKTKDKTGAMNRLAAMDAAISRGEFCPWSDTVPESGVTYTDAVERYLEARDKTDSSIRNDKSVLNALGATLPVAVGVGHVTTADVHRYLDGLDIVASTRKTYINRIRAFFSWAVGDGLVRDDPASKIEAPKVGRRTPRYLTPKQYVAVLAAIERDVRAKKSGAKDRVGYQPGTAVWLADVVRFAVGTGFRIGEVVNLRWTSVDLEGRFVSVRNEGGFRAKRDSERTVPVEGEAVAVLERLLDRRESDDDYVFKGVRGGRLNKTYVSKRFRHYARLARLPDDITFHALRRTYASWLVMAGVPIYEVSRNLGHSSVEVTARAYAYLSPGSRREGVRRVFGIDARLAP